MGRVMGILAIVLGVWIGACGDLVPSSPKVVQSRDGRTQMVVPASWREQTDLNEEADIQVANLRQELYVIVLSEYESGQFRIGGYPAVQYQLRGSELVYFHTTVEGPNSFHQIVAWTLPSRLTKNERVLQGVIRSLRVGGATS